MTGVMNISKTGRIEINEIETPTEHTEQSCARRDLADDRPDEATDH
jgi:hypothetical protein